MNRIIDFMAKIRKDITGQRFGKLVVICRDEKATAKRNHWLCICDCGNKKSIEGTKIRTGWTQSCGCYMKQRQREGQLIHGHTHFRGRSPEYGTWTNIRTRCNNPRGCGYKDYGARGIKVCPEWNGSDCFPQFLKDVGMKPSPNHSLDRIDPNGDYTKTNVRWVLKEEQARNTRRNRRFTHNEKTMCAAEWDRELGLTPGTVLRRIDVNGWTVHKALSTPFGGARRTSGLNQGTTLVKQEPYNAGLRDWLAD